MGAKSTKSFDHIWFGDLEMLGVFFFNFVLQVESSGATKDFSMNQPSSLT